LCIPGPGKGFDPLTSVSADVAVCSAGELAVATGGTAEAVTDGTGDGANAEGWLVGGTAGITDDVLAKGLRVNVSAAAEKSK